jgi:transcriptional regulator with XRE-family HTH domain
MGIEEPPTFSTLLWRYRRAADLTQEELAERAGLSVLTISALERGVKHRPRKGTVALLAEALGLAPAERTAFVGAGRAAPLSPPRRNRPPPAPLVGRRRELALLARHLSGQRAPVLLLSGEPGIGKTRLLGEATQRAVERGMCVLEGGCQRRGGQEPYVPLLSALQGHLQGLTPTQLRPLLHGCAWLVRLLPELAAGPIEPVPAWTLGPEQERRLMFAAVGRFLGNVAGPAGTLLVLDDLQWASPDALDLLIALVRSPTGAPLRVVGAYRDTEVQPQDPLSVALADLAHAGLATHLTLAPLTVQEVAQLLDQLLEEGETPGGQSDTATLREQVLRRAGGVPFFVVSWAQALRVGEPVGPQQDGVPWAVAQSVRQRVAALPHEVGEVLRAAAVVGRVVPPELVTAVVEQAERAVLTALHAACRASLLVDDREGGYQFAHDVIREVIEADLGTGQRRVLHRQIAAVLEGTPDEPPLEALAYHYTRSGEQGKAVLYLQRAADKAWAQYATTQALRYLEQALELARNSQTQQVILARRAQLLLETFQGKQAATDYVCLLQGAQQGGDHVQELAARLGLARSYYVTCLDEAPGDVAMRSRSEYEAAYTLARRLGDKRGMVQALVRTGWFRDFWPDYSDQAAANVREAVALSQEMGAEDLLIDSGLALLGPALWDQLSRAEAETWADELARRLEARHDVPRLNDLYFLLMWKHLGWGTYEQAIACCETGLRLAHHMGVPPVEYATIKALALLNLGRYGEAWTALGQEVADDAHALGQALKDFGMGVYFFEVLAYAQAAVTFAAVAAQGRRLRRPWLIQWAQTWRAQALHWAGELDEATLVTITADLASIGETLPPEVMADISLARGHLDEALRQAESAAAPPTVHRHTLYLLPIRPDHLWTCEVKARILLRLARPGDALALADEVLRGAEELHHRPLVWRLQVTRAQALLLLGDTDSAAGASEAAAGVIQQLAETIGAAPLSEEFRANALGRLRMAAVL